MVKFASLLLAAAALLNLGSSAIAQSNATNATNSNATDKQPLPIFFFHGVTLNAQAGRNLLANLTAEGRLFTALSFCQDACSSQALNNQIPLAIAQIRSIVANDSRYDNGYVFITHSQGGAIGRGVVEEMDDHNVKALVSLAGAVNGGFNGPQPEDALPLRVFVYDLGPRILPSSIFNFSKYTPEDFKGKLQRDYSDLTVNLPTLQDQYSAFNLGRSPYYQQWLKLNPYFPVINNLKVCDGEDAKCEADKERRRNNFLKLNEAHFFASPADEFISPWQQSHLAYYSEVDSSEEIETKWSSLKILNFNDTREYVNDTYGLQTLDKRGGLFFHTAQKIGHSCWLKDYVPTGQTETCFFQPNYNDVVFPVLQGPAFFTAKYISQ
ncbi:hypothetical protein Gpo141_00013931 [Globisporangium polare]